ncbi:hypothetical protein T484DRAFT_1777889 [Baffinella frigidus]|nr:hypothetical protein T484DRAFT_1777889 [Cryptophyta sp. CCMP2293]
MGIPPRPTQLLTAHIFISYAPANKPWALKLAKKLENKEYSVWVEEAERMEDQFRIGVVNAAVFLLCWYHTGARARTEATQAAELHKKILVLVVDRPLDDREPTWVDSIIEGADSVLDFTDPMRDLTSTAELVSTLKTRGQKNKKEQVKPKQGQKDKAEQMKPNKSALRREMSQGGRGSFMNQRTGLGVEQGRSLEDRERMLNCLNPKP